MTAKIISTYIAAGYTLSSSFDGLIITSTGGVGGTGVTAHPGAYVNNYGKINANGTGIDLVGSGAVENFAGASITAYRGIVSYGAGAAVLNYGVIKASGKAVVLHKGGEVDNGGPFNFTASISGGVYLYGAGSVVDNYATIKNGEVYIFGGGTITNGSTGDVTASLDGEGVKIAGGAGTVQNLGLINAHGREGVTFEAGGQVVNGAAADRSASILGSSGVVVTGGAGAVTNFGVIRGTGGDSFFYGVELGSGGTVTNGTALDEVALIEGYEGVGIRFAAATVVNFGAIQGDGLTSFGVYSQAGGSVTNGGGDDHGALIQGGAGVILGAAGTVHNYGTIRGATGYGVHLAAGGVVTNGSPTNGAALIEGYEAVVVGAAGSVTNLGTILGTGDGGGSGVYLGAGVTVVNGDATHRGARIEGFYGLGASGGSDTLINFGTIVGDAGVAVSLHKASDLLVVEAGCAFVGAVYGGGGTLKLDDGTGRLSGLFGAGRSVTVTGSMAATTFQDFATLRIGQTATFVASGNVNLTAGEAILNSGSLTLGGAKAGVASAGLVEADRGTLAIAGAVTNTGTLAAAGGTLVVAGAVTGGGSATLAGGALDFEAAFTEDVAFTGKSGMLELARSQAYAGTVSGFSKSGGTSLDLDDIAFSKATTAKYSGTKSGGTLTVTDGTHTAHIKLKGDYTQSTFVVASDGNGGTIVHDPARFVAAVAGFGAGGGTDLVASRAEPWREGPPLLSAPRVQFA